MARTVPGIAVVAGVLVGAAAVVAALATRAGGGGPPVVLVTIDTLRADRLGCCGSGRSLTPNLDRLAAGGAVFEDAASASPLTLPSHATLLTGLLPPRHGLRDNDTPRPLPGPGSRDFSTAAEIFRASGCATAAFVSGAPLAPRWGLDAGFDAYDAPAEGEPGSLGLGERAGGATVDRALGWLRGRDPGRPFFLWVHLFDPHLPYRAPGGAGLPTDSPEAYDEEVAYADAQAGRILDELRRSGLLDRAVVAVCADHGEGLGEHGEATHGYFLHRSTLRVPLLLSAPGRVPAGARVKAPVSLADLLPTLLDASRRRLPGLPLDGRSLLPLVRPGAGEAPPPSAQYAETLYGWRAFRWAQSVSMRSGDLRVIDHGGSRREAYDLSSDPGETRDLAAAGSPPPAAAEAARDAWSLFTSPPRTRASVAPGPAPDPGLQALGYVTGYGPLEVFGAEANGRLPPPSPSFVRRFDAALRLLERARTEEIAAEADAELEDARRILGELDREEPSNPAPPFWIGRGIRQKAKLSGPGAVLPWYEAFSMFQEAGRRGYREPRTASLMMEAAFHANQIQDMGKVAADAVEGAKMDGDASFWTWVALARILGGRDASGALPSAVRASAEEAMDRAKAGARSEGELTRIREVEALFR